MAKVVVLAIAVAAAIPDSAVQAQLTEDYRFKGRIVDTARVPIPSVQVTFRELSTGARIVFTTKKDGTFDRRMIPHGNYEVHFEKSGYLTRIEQFEWDATAPQTIVKEAEIVLQSYVEHAEREHDAKATGLYEEAYASLQANDCATARARAEALLGLGAGAREYAVRFILARCQALSGQDSAAAIEYARVIELKPDLFEAHFDLGGVLERLGAHDRAIESFVSAATLRPDDAETHYNIGALLFRQQQFAAARPHLERALAADSTHAQACKALGYSYLQGEPRDLVAARRFLEQYLRLQPLAADTTQVREILHSIAAPE